MSADSLTYLDLILSNVKDEPTKEAKKLRECRPIDVSKLRGDQPEAFEQLNNWLNNSDDRFFLLNGYAGSGKSFLLAQWLEHNFACERFHSMVGFTATTNKAVKVLRDKTNFTHARLRIATIHSLLKLKKKINDNGQLSFVQELINEDPPLNNYQIVIVDESSMLEDDLFNLLLEYPIKILFVGDEAQIPPVNLPNSLPFDKETQAELNFWVFNMTQPIRQHEDNPILNMSIDIRGNLNKRYYNPGKNYGALNQDYGIIHLDSQDPHDKAELFNLITGLFSQPKFRSDSNFVKIVAWRNQIVRNFNDIVRSRIYNTKEQLVIGEKMIANTTVIHKEKDDVIIMDANDEFTVLSFEEKTMDFEEIGIYVKYYETKICITGKDGVHSIDIMKEESKEQYDEFLQLLFEKADAEPSGSYERKNWFKEYYRYKDYFADVIYNYSITGHKSQGSTYEICIVYDRDIKKNSDFLTRNRIRYTACTRPSRYLIWIT